MWPGGLGERERFTPRPRLADDDEIGLFLEQCAQAGPQDRMIVRENQFDGSRAAGSVGPDHQDALLQSCSTTSSKFHTCWEGLRGRHAA